MSTIVVTTDLSDAARRALPAAKQLADSLGVSLVLLHVVHAPALAPAFSGSVDLDKADAERELTELASGLGGDVKTRVLEAEDVVAGIASEAVALAAELLVVASHGRTGLQRLRLGSVAESLLDASPVPVVCVPAYDDDAGENRRIVVTSDLSETAARAFPVARRIAQALSLPMTLLVIGEESAAESPLLKAHAAELGGGDATAVATQVVTAPDTAAGIVEHAKLEDAAFVCTAAAPKSALWRWLLGSVSREVMRAGTFPVVIVPAPPV